ncbi:terminase large subunit domain-containing protein [Paraoerskovia sediminicola]|nr:terminase large subunit [Paraoerskovia sediminicola]
MRSQPVALLGEAPPRVLVKPQGVRASSARDVAELSAQFGVYLDGWQELILEAAMGERSDSTWAAKRVGISVPRQNGKSLLMVSRILAGALLFGEKKIVVSAHQQDTAREAFSKLVEIIESDGNSALQARVRSVMHAFQRESVKFTNGAVVQFKARTGPGGKGFSSDCLLLDEAQILGARSWTSINSTMSAMRNPQVWLLGTPPQDEDDSYTFEMVRKAALAGKSSNAAWCEWGVDRGSEEYLAAKPDLDARRWTPAVEYLCWESNPAWNGRINHEIVQGEFETYSSERFAQDRHGAWKEEGRGSLRRSMSPGGRSSPWTGRLRQMSGPLLWCSIVTVSRSRCLAR